MSLLMLWRKQNPNLQHGCESMASRLLSRTMKWTGKHASLEHLALHSPVGSACRLQALEEPKEQWTC